MNGYSTTYIRDTWMPVAQKTGDIVGCGEDYITLPYNEYKIVEQTS